MKNQKETDSLLPSVNVASAAGDYIRNEMGQFISPHPGMPKRFKDSEELQNAILKYFSHCEQEKKHLTMTGLAIALGFRNRSSLVAYEKEEGYEFAHNIIQYAKMKIEEYTEQRLHDPKANVVGAIFSLKNNWNWQDRQDIRVQNNKMVIKGFELIEPEE
jgi:hypothetical protein